MPDERYTLRQEYGDLLKQQCDLLQDLAGETALQLVALRDSGPEETEARAAAMNQSIATVEQLMQRSNTLEQQLAELYAPVAAEQRAAEMAALLQLRLKRTELLQAGVEAQQTYYDAMAEYVDSLIKEGRDLSQSAQAFHSYRRAAQLDKPLLNVRK